MNRCASKSSRPAAAGRGRVESNSQTAIVRPSVALRDATRPVVETLESRQLMCVDAGFSASVNFAPSSVGLIEGYAADTGKVFTDYDSGLSYGWSSINTSAARVRANRAVPSK